MTTSSCIRHSAPKADFSQGQLVYVLVYSHIFFGDRQQSSVTLSLRNTDLTNPIDITSARYYDEKDKLGKDFVPRRLPSTLWL